MDYWDWFAPCEAPATSKPPAEQAQAQAGELQEEIQLALNGLPQLAVNLRYDGQTSRAETIERIVAIFRRLAGGVTVDDAMVERALIFRAMEEDQAVWPGAYSADEQEMERKAMKRVLAAALNAAVVPPLVTEEMIDAALPHLIGVAGSEARPIGQFYSGHTADESEHLNWKLYGRDRARAALVAALGAKCDQLRQRVAELEDARERAYDNRDMALQAAEHEKDRADAAEAKLALAEQDARRYRWLRDVPCCTISVSRNDGHAVNYMSFAEWAEESEKWYEDVPADELERMKEANTDWAVQIYPVTPIGFYVFHGATLDTAIDAAIASQGEK